MKFMHRHSSLEEDEFADPMSGVANLFDTAVVFISALLLALMTLFDTQDLFKKDSRFTLIREDGQQEMTIIQKEGKRIKAVKMYREEASGRGVRLGVAYRLEDGTMIYVPENEK
jgi:hypothetical protein